MLNASEMLLVASITLLRSNNVEQPSGKLDPALWRLPASFPEGRAEPI
jgi:hypothetical protein